MRGLHTLLLIGKSMKKPELLALINSCPDNADFIIGADDKAKDIWFARVGCFGYQLYAVDLDMHLVDQQTRLPEEARSMEQEESKLRALREETLDKIKIVEAVAKVYQRRPEFRQGKVPDKSTIKKAKTK